MNDNLTNSDRENQTDSELINNLLSNKITKWKEKLIDLTKRNRLLNFKRIVGWILTQQTVTLNWIQGLVVKESKHIVCTYYFVPIILSFLSDEKRKNNVYPNKKEKRTAPAESELTSARFIGLRPSIILRDLSRRIYSAQTKLWLLLHTFKSLISFLNSTDFDYSGSRFSWLHFQTSSLSFRRKTPTYEFRSLRSTSLYRKSIKKPS